MAWIVTASASTIALPCASRNATSASTFDAPLRGRPGSRDRDVAARVKLPWSLVAELARCLPTADFECEQRPSCFAGPAQHELAQTTAVVAQDERAAKLDLAKHVRTRAECLAHCTERHFDVARARENRR